MDDRIATGLWVEAKLRELGRGAISYYIVNKGAYFSGTVLLKINGLNGEVRLLTRMRNHLGEMEWMPSLLKDIMPEAEADAYIKRSISRDPDIWIIEIENKKLENDFEDAALHHL